MSWHGATTLWRCKKNQNGTRVSFIILTTSLRLFLLLLLLPILLLNNTAFYFDFGLLVAHFSVKTCLSSLCLQMFPISRSRSILGWYHSFRYEHQPQWIRNFAFLDYGKHMQWIYFSYFRFLTFDIKNERNKLKEKLLSFRGRAFDELRLRQLTIYKYIYICY